MKFRHPSRISLRLLAFNVLLVFLPVGGVLFLDTYESHLLVAQERTMAQEGRLLAAAIEARDRFESEDAQRILIQLGQRHLARLRGQAVPAWPRKGIFISVFSVIVFPTIVFSYLMTTSFRALASPIDLKCA